MFGHMKHPVNGTARLVSYEETNVRNEFDTTIVAQVIVEGDGVPATAVESHIGVPNSQLPLDAGTTWQVVFERDDPKHFKALEPDKQTVEADHTAAMLQAQQLAEQMRAAGAGGAAPAGGPGTPGVTPIVIAGNADPAQVAAALGKVQQMFGIDLSGVAATQAAQAQGQPTPAAATDTVSQLERLAKLHESGVLTDDEFATEKQKILGAG